MRITRKSIKICFKISHNLKISKTPLIMRTLLAIVYVRIRRTRQKINGWKYFFRETKSSSNFFVQINSRRRTEQINLSAKSAKPFVNVEFWRIFVKKISHDNNFRQSEIESKL